MKVWNRRTEWPQIQAMEAFCLTISRNLSLDKLRRMDNQLRSEGAPPADLLETAVSGNPEEQAVQRDRVALVRQLMSQLPEKQRSCMQLRDIEGKAYKDIADILGMTEQQVKTNIFRARQTIKERFLKIDSDA